MTDDGRTTPRGVPVEGGGIGAGGRTGELAGEAAAGAGSDVSGDLGASLAPLRERIDEIDREIVALLNERAGIALEIGRVKDAQGGTPIRDPAREAAVIERVTSASAGLFPQPELVALYRTLIAATRKVQEEQRRATRPADGDPA